MDSEPREEGRGRAIVLGASGGIGGAMADRLEAAGHEVVRLSRSPDTAMPVDLTDERSIAAAAAQLARTAPFDLVIVATGLLQSGPIRPEKSFKELEAETLLRYFAVNAVGPALVARYFVPLLPRTGRCVLAFLSARVGSIGDNAMGGWYGYRASKAALNMLVKTLAIEVKRTRPEAICVTLHPGTVDTELSRPFQRNVPKERLFTPADAAHKLLRVIDGLSPDQSGNCIAWDGQRIVP